MEKTYFITDNFIKKNTAFNNNIDMTKVDHLINMSFDITIVPLLGSYFSDYLLNKHQDMLAENYVYTTFEEKLVDLIQYTMAWDVCYNAVYELSDQLQNKGPLKQNGDFQSPSSDSQVKYMAQRYKQNVEAYKNRLNKFLCKNHIEFADFIIDDNDDSDVKESCTGCNKGLDNLQDYGMFFV